MSYKIITRLDRLLQDITRLLVLQDYIDEVSIFIFISALLCTNLLLIIKVKVSCKKVNWGKMVWEATVNDFIEKIQHAWHCHESHRNKWGQRICSKLTICDWKNTRHARMENWKKVVCAVRSKTWMV